MPTFNVKKLSEVSTTVQQVREDISSIATTLKKQGFFESSDSTVGDDIRNKLTTICQNLDEALENFSIQPPIIVQNKQQELEKELEFVTSFINYHDKIATLNPDKLRDFDRGWFESLPDLSPRIRIGIADGLIGLAQKHSISPLILWQEIIDSGNNYFLKE